MDSAAPQKREMTKTPGSEVWEATNTLATKSMPSRREVTRQVSASR